MDVAADVLNKQQRTAIRHGLASWGFAKGLTRLYHKKSTCYKLLYLAFDTVAEAWNLDFLQMFML
jgi:hypothetical protein